MCEVRDLRRFARCCTFMGFCGLLPSEYSPGATVSRVHISHAGDVHVRTQLVEPAWAYRHGPSAGVTMCRRQVQLSDHETIELDWRAQPRLCRRFRRLGACKDFSNVVLTANGWDLTGLVHPEMTA